MKSSSPADTPARVSRFATETTQRAAQVLQAVGTTGLKNLGGQIQEEYLTALKSWSREVKIYLEMRDDPVIGTLLDAIKLPLLAAEFDCTPAGDSKADEEAAVWLYDNLNGMKRQAWRSHVMDALEVLDFGFAIAVPVLEKREDGRLWLKSIEPRGQETLYNWDFSPEEPDKATAFNQQDPDNGQFHNIPLERCLHFAFRGRKGNPQGRSLLRSLFKPWRILTDLQNLEAIGMERDVGGMPICELPEDPLEDSDMDAVKKALKAMRIDEAMYLLVPHGAKVTPYAAGAKQYDSDRIINRYIKLILMRMFAQFLMLGMENAGTQALVQGSQDFFSLGVKAVQQEVLEIWNQQLVPFLFQFNSWKGLTGLPVITWSDPGKVDIKALLETYKLGLDAKTITPIRPDEEHVRALMDLPDLPEGIGEGPRNVESPAFPPIWNPEASNAQ